MTSFEAMNSVFNVSHENKSFSIGIPGRWRILNYLEVGIIDKLKDLLKHRSANHFELHVKEVKKGGNKII